MPAIVLAIINNVNEQLLKDAVPVVCAVTMEHHNLLHISMTLYKSLGDCDCNWEVLDTCQDAAKMLITRGLAAYTQQEQLALLFTLTIYPVR